MKKPLVAVFMVTYNHEKYIEQAIESVLMQKTTFPIKLFIGEDCSTDGTSELCMKYKEDFPELVEPILNKQNIGASKNARQMFDICFSSGAEYIAMLEGDDYWTDPLKLQKQVDFLESNPDFSMACHNVVVIGDINQAKYVNKYEDYYTALELATGDISIPTLSVVFRNYNLEVPKLMSKAVIGDFPLFLLIAQNGKIKYFPEIMGARRVHKGGLWSSADKSAKLSALLITIYFMIGNYNEEINNALIQYHLKLVANSIKEGVSTDLYPKEMNWIIEIMSRYKRFRKVFRNFGLFKPLKKILGKSKN